MSHEWEDIPFGMVKRFPRAWLSTEKGASETDFSRKNGGNLAWSAWATSVTLPQPERHARLSNLLASPEHSGVKGVSHGGWHHVR